MQSEINLQGQQEAAGTAVNRAVRHRATGIPPRYCGISWPGSVVGTATGYGLDGPGIEFWWG